MTTATAPTKAPPKANRETWRDWMPADAPEPAPEHWWTREDIVSELASRDVSVSPDDIRYWENAGILPKGIRRRHKGATRAIYPRWYGTLVFQLRKMQDEGYTLAQIKKRLRSIADFVTGSGDTPAHRELRELFTRFDPPVSSHEEYNALNPVLIPDYEGVIDPAAIPLGWDVIGGLRRVARHHETFTGVKSARVEIFVVDEDGHRTGYTINLASQDPE